MHGDFFTKPLQGTLFRTHRAMILGLPSASNVELPEEETFKDVLDNDPQERVEPYLIRGENLDN